MPESEPSWTVHRSRLARAVRDGDLDVAEQARRDMKAARAADYIRRLVDEAPPLTSDQLERLAAILRAGRPAAGGSDAA